MKSRFCQKPHRFAAVLLAFLAALPLNCGLMCANAEIIPISNRVDWIPGVTVGVRVSIPLRTNLIDVSMPPYNADRSGAANAAPAIQAAINAAAPNDVVYFPAGRYLLSGNLYCNKSSVTLRGAITTNGTPAATLISGQGVSYLLTIGGGENQGSLFTVTNGYTKGSTNLVIDSAMQGIVGPLVPGDGLLISQQNGSDESFNVISTGNYDRVLAQHVIIASKSGNSITLTTPLVCDFNRKPMVRSLGFQAKRGIGLENLRLTCTNELTGAVGSALCLLSMNLVYDSWVENCEFYYANYYHVSMSSCVNVQMRRSKLHKSAGAGSNHAGLLLASSSCLIEDNIIADGLQPAIEFNSGVGNAFFANFMTNNILEIDCHNAHPAFNLFEQNVGNHVIMDGYFGSTSHHTFFRNKLDSSYCVVAFRRWTTHVNLVGNVLGRSGATYPGYISESSASDAGIFSLGKPNIGNPNYSGESPPIAWNFPGRMINLIDGRVWTNGAFVFTNAPAYPTNRITLAMGSGTLTNLPNPYSSLYPVIFQDGANTNAYWPDDGIVLTTDSGQASAWNGSYVQLNRSIRFTNGWRIFIAGQNQYQQLQKGNRLTHLIHGNYDYFNNSVIWDASIADHAIPASMLYPRGAPSWWGTNRWPAIDPAGTPLVTPIPAQNRYLGIGLGAPEAPAALSAVSTSNSTIVVLSWTTSNGLGVTGYQVARAQELGSTDYNVIASPGGTFYTDTNVTSGKIYYYRVRARDTNGNLSAYSVSATVTNFTPPRLRAGN